MDKKTTGKNKSLEEKRATLKIRIDEHQEQVTVIDWALRSEGRWPELHWLYAVPNGAKLPFKTVTRNGRSFRVCPEAQKLKDEGLRSGVPDLCLPVPRGGYCGLYIEMKALDGDPSEAQMNWLEGLNALGHMAALAYGANQAIQTIESYLALPKPNGRV